MNKILLFSALALFGTTVQAGHYGNYDGDSDMEQSVLNDHGEGTISSSVHPGLNDEYGSVRLDILSLDIDSLPPTAAGSKHWNEGIADDYGSVFFDVSPR